jgi:formylglycine-generating enzyme required for sulfatase activity/serine/threonine protein kinase
VARRAGRFIVTGIKSETPHRRLYAAESERGERFDLKELSFSEVPLPEQVDGFNNEARMLLELNHPAIPDFVDAFEEGAGRGLRLYLAQSMPHGEGLDALARARRVDESLALEVARQTLEALRDLHNHAPPILHRNIRPESIIVCPDGRVALIDFGTSRELVSQAKQGPTPNPLPEYAPPEQPSGAMDVTADLYSLGLTILNAVTGKPPSSFMKRGQLDLSGAALSPLLQHLISKLSAPSREFRFASAEAALERLETPIPNAVSIPSRRGFSPTPVSGAAPIGPTSAPGAPAGPTSLSQRLGLPGPDSIPSANSIPGATSIPGPKSKPGASAGAGPTSFPVLKSLPGVTSDPRATARVPPTSFPQLKSLPGITSDPRLATAAPPVETPTPPATSVVDAAAAAAEQPASPAATSSPALASPPGITADPPATPANGAVAPPAAARLEPAGKRTAASRPLALAIIVLVSMTVTALVGWRLFVRSRRIAAVGSDRAGAAGVQTGKAPQVVESRSGLTFVLLPAGSFHFGCVDNDRDCYPWEKPSRAVDVPAFKIGQTEVTVEAYGKCVKAGACDEPKAGDGDEGGPCNWNTPRQNHPVNCVNWFQSDQFCRWVGGSLPTAVQWEYAAKSAGRDNIFPWGNDPVTGTRTNGCDKNCPNPPEADNAVDDAFVYTAPVMSFPSGATDQGVFDMAGNVWEWTSDWWDERNKEVRGGSFSSKSRTLRNSYRDRWGEPHRRSSWLGFRCVM